MEIKIYLFLITLLTFGCNAQNAVTTNEIFKTKDNLFGVKSKEGKLLIDSIYSEIRIVFEREKLILPPKDKQDLVRLEFYLVSNANNQKALFNKDGKLVFNFIDCLSIMVDEYTQTVVITKNVPEYRSPRSYLYNTNGELLFDMSFEKIAFINHSDLIALIVKEKSNDEYYLYNPFEKKKIGPFDHFNIYNEDFTTPKGMTESNYVKYKNTLNVLTVRRKTDDDYRWGIIDSKGNSILPLEYINLKLFLDSDKNHPAFKQAIKPEGIDFIFRGMHISNKSTSIYFDSNLEKYEFKIILGEKREYRIEKM